MQTTDEGFSRPLILSIHLSASKFANLDVTASRKSKIFDRFCASGWSGLRDPQPLTESQSCSSILANRHYFVCCKRKKESVLLQTDRHFLCRRTFLIFFMSWWWFKICSAWQRALWQEFGCWQDKDKTGTDLHSNQLLSCSSYVLTSVCEEGFVLSWNWVLLGQTEMQEWTGGMRLGVSKLWQSWWRSEGFCSQGSKGHSIGRHGCLVNWIEEEAEHSPQQIKTTNHFWCLYVPFLLTLFVLCCSLEKKQTMPFSWNTWKALLEAQTRRIWSDSTVVVGLNSPAFSE